jgi:hypothetical protein
VYVNDALICWHRPSPSAHVPGQLKVFVKSLAAAAVVLRLSSSYGHAGFWLPD